MLIKVGPSSFSIDFNERWASSISERFCDWRADDESVSDFRIVLNDARSRLNRGRRIRTISQEVGVYTSKPREYDVELRHTVRSLARRAKRVFQKSHYMSGRWSLLLRNAIEHPILANLEFAYGYLALHAATVRSAEGAISILGCNGAGKSTLASYLIDQLGFELVSDNFSPTNGASVLGFPGRPRAKPGDRLAAAAPKPGHNVLKGIVLIGPEWLTSKESLRGQLRRYLSLPYDSHRDTQWVEEFVGSVSAMRELDDLIAARLSNLPIFKYDYRVLASSSVVSFIKESLK